RRSAAGGRTWSGPRAACPYAGVLGAAGGFVFAPHDPAGKLRCSPDGGVWHACGRIGGGPGSTLVRLHRDSSLDGPRLVAELEPEGNSGSRFLVRAKTGWRTLASYPGGFTPESSVVVAGDTVSVGSGTQAEDDSSQQLVMRAAEGRTGHRVPLEGVLAPAPFRSVSSAATHEGLTVAVGGADSGSVILTTGDGTTWTRRAEAQSWTLSSVAHGPHGWAAVGGDTVLTSADGLTWT
ncbi:hypothetical protein, partial [Actinocorallia lasiicapitis]